MAGFGRLLGRRWGTLAAILGIAVYAVLAGASFSVLRAALMGSLALIAAQFGRQTGANTLAITAGVLSAFQPYAPWDPGFQLSFGATLGLVLYASPLQSGFTRMLARRLPLERARAIAEPVGEYFLFTLAAQAMTLPVIAYQFQRLSLVSILTNPVVLPVQPPLMIFGGLAVVAGMVWRPLGQVIGYLAWPFLAFTIRVIELFARIPGGNLALGSIALVVVVAIYMLILALTVWRAQAKEKLRTLGPATVLVALGLAAAFAWRAGFAAPDGRLHITILDVSSGGQSGDGVLVRTPEGRSLLIDGGPSAIRLSDALGQRLPPYDRGLDWLAVALPGDEQLTSLPRVLDRFRPAAVLWAGPEHDTRGARDVQAALAQRGITPLLAAPGQAFDLGKGAFLRVLTVGKRGATLLLEWGSFRMLLSVGINLEDMKALEDGRTIGNVSALLLADASSAASNPPEWLANLHPQVALISVSAADLQELPSPETLALLQGYSVLRTDRNGWIELTTDGEKMWVEVERK